MKKKKVKYYYIPIMQKNIIENPFNQSWGDWENLMFGKICNTAEDYHNSVHKLVESTYKKIMSGKIKFNYIPDFDKSCVEIEIYGDGYRTHGVIMYKNRHNYNSIRIAEIELLKIHIYGKNEWVTLGMYEEWQLLRYNDKFFFIAPNDDEEFSNGQNKIIADFDTSIPIKKIIMKAVEYINPQHQFIH